MAAAMAAAGLSAPATLLPHKAPRSSRRVAGTRAPTCMSSSRQENTLQKVLLAGPRAALGALALQTELLMDPKKLNATIEDAQGRLNNFVQDPRPIGDKAASLASELQDEVEKLLAKGVETEQNIMSMVSGTPPARAASSAAEAVGATPNARQGPRDVKTLADAQLEAEVALVAQEVVDLREALVSLEVATQLKVSADMVGADAVPASAGGPSKKMAVMKLRERRDRLSRQLQEIRTSERWNVPADVPLQAALDEVTALMLDLELMPLPIS
eukprot:jgi/Chlat1/3627/Chrsp237S03621